MAIYSLTVRANLRNPSLVKIAVEFARFVRNFGLPQSIMVVLVELLRLNGTAAV